MSDAGIVRGEDGVARCWWADSAPEYRAYHDGELGFPVSDDVRLDDHLAGCDAEAAVERARARFKRPR